MDSSCLTSQPQTVQNYDRKNKSGQQCHHQPADEQAAAWSFARFNLGPGDVARWIGYALLVLALWSGIAAFRETPVRPPRQDVVSVLWVAGGLAAQILLLKTAGFAIATGLLFAFTARGFGKRNLALTVPVGIIFALVVYLVFAGLLKLTLPAGPLEHLFLGK